MYETWRIKKKVNMHKCSVCTSQPSAPYILNIAFPTTVADTKSRDKPSWLFSSCVWNVNCQLTDLAPAFSVQREWVSERLLPLHLSQSPTISSCSCRQSLVFPRLMIRYSWWRGSLGVIFVAPNFTHIIFNPLSCTGTQWIEDKVMIN